MSPTESEIASAKLLEEEIERFLPLSDVSHAAADRILELLFPFQDNDWALELMGSIADYEPWGAPPGGGVDEYAVSASEFATQLRQALPLIHAISCGLEA